MVWFVSVTLLAPGIDLAIFDPYEIMLVKNHSSLGWGIFAIRNFVLVYVRIGCHFELQLIWCLNSWLFEYIRASEVVCWSTQKRRKK